MWRYIGCASPPLFSDNTLHLFSKICQLTTDVVQLDLEIAATFNLRQKSCKNENPTAHGLCHYVRPVNILKLI